MKKLIFLALCIIISGCDGCKDPDDCPDRFHVPAEVTPYKKEYRIGDTIFVRSIFKRNIHDLRTDRTYDLGNINLYPHTLIHFLDTIGRTKISDYFKMGFITTAYSEFVFSSGGSELDGQYEFQNDTFELVFFIIPVRTGNFLLFQKCGIGPTFNDTDFPGRCHGVGYDVIVDMNAGKDGNLEILKESIDSLYNTWILLDPKGRFYERGGFCFKVVP